MNVNSANNCNFGANYSAIVRNKLGLHMAPSGAIAKITSIVDKPIYLSTEDKVERNVRNSILSVMTLGATQGKEVFVRVEDNYPQDILRAVLDCINSESDNVAINILKSLKNRINIFM